MSEAKERVFGRLSGLVAGSGGAERMPAAASSVSDSATCSDQRERAIEMTPGAGPGVWAFAMCLVSLLVAFGGNWAVPNCARAEQDEVQKARVEAGRVWYEKYCLPCHGAGGAPGKALYRASKQPVDLRSYVKRHGGVFPAAEWIAAVYSPNPADPHVEVWETLKRAQGAVPQPEFGARGLVAVMADYIVSVQTK